MSRKWKRKRGYKLQCKLPQQYTRVVFITKAIVSSPVKQGGGEGNGGGGRGGAEEENK